MTATVHPSDLAIGEILAKADPATKLVISAYRHDQQHTKNVQALSSAKFSAENLETCANFLGLKTRDGDKGKIFSNKQTLADRIILKIESHFDAECAACEEVYRNKLADKPLKVCFRCLQGSHDCDKMKGANIDLSMPGAVWLCKGCHRQFDALAPTKEKKGRKGESLNLQLQHSASQNVREVPNEEISPDEEAETNTNTDAHTGTNSNVQLVEENNHSSDPASSETVRSSRNTQRVICEKYVKNCCPHGISGTRKINGRKCEKDHPRACPRWLKNGPRKYGCNRRNCKLFHPVLCRYSVRSRRCENLACTYVHIAYTRRWPASEDEFQSHTNNTGAGTQEQTTNGDINSYQNPPAENRQQSYSQHQAAHDQNLENSYLAQLITDMRQDFQTELDQMKKQLNEQRTYVPPPVWHLPTQPAQQFGQAQMYAKANPNPNTIPYHYPNQQIPGQQIRPIQ